MATKEANKINTELIRDVQRVMHEERSAVTQQFPYDRNNVWVTVSLTGELEQAILDAVLEGRVDNLEFNLEHWANPVRDIFLEHMKHPFLRLGNNQTIQRDDPYIAEMNPSFPDNRWFERVTFYRSILNGLYLRSFTPKFSYRAMAPLAVIGADHLLDEPKRRLTRSLS